MSGGPESGHRCRTVVRVKVDLGDVGIRVNGVLRWRLE